VAVARYSSINEYLLPSLLYVAVLLLPLLPYVNGWDSPLIYLHPLQALLVVIQAAFQPVEFWRIMYGLLYAGLWIGLVYLLARRALRRFVIAEVGAS
jgi:fluoroquinolone transport system permease protein